MSYARLNVRRKNIRLIEGALAAMPQEDTSPQKVTDVFSEPMTTAIKKISNEILLTAVVFGLILAMIAVFGRFSYEVGFMILALFYGGVFAYVIIRPRTVASGLPPGRIAKTSELKQHISWSAPKEITLPDPLKASDYKPKLERLRFKIPFSVASEKPVYVFLEVRSQFQSIVFIPDMVLRKWNWKTFRHEVTSVALNDVRIVRTAVGSAKSELEFNGCYRLMYAIRDTVIRRQLPLWYHLWASYDFRTWQDVSGPGTIYVTIVSDDSKVREALGLGAS
jgi:hypothetical protein